MTYFWDALDLSITVLPLITREVQAHLIGSKIGLYLTEQHPINDLCNPGGIQSTIGAYRTFRFVIQPISSNLRFHDGGCVFEVYMSSLSKRYSAMSMVQVLLVDVRNIV